MAKPKQQEMKHKPRVKRAKNDIHADLDKAAKALDTSRSERIEAGIEEKKDEQKCIDLMAGKDLVEYQLSDGRVLKYAPKSSKMGCKIVAADEDEHAPAQGALEEVD